MNSNSSSSIPVYNSSHGTFITSNNAFFAARPSFVHNCAKGAAAPASTTTANTSTNTTNTSTMNNSNSYFGNDAYFFNASTSRSNANNNNNNNNSSSRGSNKNSHNNIYSQYFHYFNLSSSPCSPPNARATYSTASSSAASFSTPHTNESKCYNATTNQNFYAYTFQPTQPDDMLLILEDPFDANKLTVQMTRTHLGPNGEEQRVTVERDFKNQNDLNKFLKDLEVNLSDAWSFHSNKSKSSGKSSSSSKHKPSSSSTYLNDDLKSPG